MTKFLAGLHRWLFAALMAIFIQFPVVAQSPDNADNIQTARTEVTPSKAFLFESDNFIMSGNIDQEPGKALLADLETFRAAVFLAIGETYEREPQKIRVYFSQSEGDFTLVTNKPGAGGIYKRTLEGPIFTINGFSGRATAADIRRIAYHELTHHMLGSYYSGTLPIWLGEGLAEYFSAYERHSDGRFSVGQNIPENIIMLQQFDWMTPRTLLESMKKYPFRSMDRSGNGFSYVDFFYAQSWIAAHYFQSDAARYEKLQTFIEKLDPQYDSEEIYTQVFGGDYFTFEDGLRAYANAGIFTPQTFMSTHGQDDFPVKITAISSSQLLFRKAEMARKMRGQGADMVNIIALHGELRAAQGESIALKIAKDRALMKTGLYSAAAESLTDTQQLAPDNLDLKTALGVALMHKHMGTDVSPVREDIIRARTLLLDVVRAEPARAEAHYYYALSYVITGRPAPKSALPSAYAAMKYMQASEFAQQKLFLAPILMTHKEYDAAETLIDNVLKWPNDYEIEKTARRMKRRVEDLREDY